MAGPRKPNDPGWDPALDDDAEIFVEMPTAKSDVNPLRAAEEITANVGLPPDEFSDEDTQPGIDQSAPLIAEPLPEMYPDIWQAGIQAVVSVADDGAPAWPTPEEWAAEARRYRTESAHTDDPAEAARLLLAAARALEQADDLAQAERVCDEALSNNPNAPEALRVRARLAEGRGDLDDAHALWARMATAVQSADERAHYGALTAEWTLARGGKLPPIARQAIPAGPARALAQAEEALRAGAPADVANALADAGRGMGGALGAALLDQAARFREVGRDRIAAASERAEAVKLDPYAPPSLPARLRDAARADDRRAPALLDELTAEPEGVLSTALARWSAEVAIRSGDKKRAAALRERLAPVTAAAARDRIDQEAASGAPIDPASLERLRASITGAAGVAVLTWIEAGNLARRGEIGAALTLMGQVITENADAIPLGLLAQQIAADTTDAEARATAFDLWLRSDPGRRAEAALALAEARTVATGAEDPLAARAALQTAIEAAPGSALFWSVAAADARAGRQADASATLSYGADMWGPSALAPGLRACALSHLALAEPARAFEDLKARLGGAPAPATHAFELEARARLAERAGDAGALASMLAAAADAADPERAASLAARRADLVDATADSAGRARILEAALRDVPGDPAVLPLLLLEEAVAPDAAGEALWRAGAAASDAAAAPAARLYRFAANEIAAIGSDDRGAVGRAAELLGAAPGDRLAKRALVRAAGRLPADQKARAIAERVGQQEEAAAGPSADAADAGLALSIAEALADADDARAPVAFGALTSGRFGANAKRALARLDAGARGPGESAGLPAELLAGPSDDAVATARIAVTDLLDAARGGHWADAVTSLRDAPPHEAAAGPATLHAASLLAEGRGRPADAAALDAAALAAAGGDPDALSVSVLARIVEGDGKPELRLAALELAAVRFTRDDAKVALAAVDSMLARLIEDGGDAVGAAERWRAALAVDPRCLPAARAIRRDAARRGDLPMAVDATEAEAACLELPENRVHALLLAAALAEDAARGQSEQSGQGGEDAGVPHRRRAIALLRAVLEIDPGHEAAFEQLRALLAADDDTAALSAALSARIGVAANPFEVTSLRLARAELLAGKLGDRAGARAELDAILHKQPEHPRALARLSELLWEEQAWSEAGEVYLRRTAVERDPAALRESFLRLGHIYRERVPDARRAITAYERVRGIEPDNRDALKALSDLYLTEEDTKQALPVTERLVATEPDPKRRTTYRVRLGDLLMRAGDLRRAGIELRRAVDSDPRNVAAVTALAHLLERARDMGGRRALLDHTVGLLRHDVERGEVDIETLRAIGALLILRERPRAAAAVADLVGVLSAAAQGLKPARPARPGRSVHGLRNPEIDERSFPPGLPPGIRQLMRLVGPYLRPSGGELAQTLAHHGVSRSERAGRGEDPRPLFDSVAAELGATDYELYVKPVPASGPVPVRAEPGSPAPVIIGAPIVAMGPGAVRFAAARALRLTATNLDQLAAVGPEEAAALVVGIIRQFVPDFLHPAVRDALVDADAARAARLIPRKIKPAASAFAIESAGPFDVVALHAAVRDGANAAGLLASADLPAALAVVLATAGTRDPALALPPIAANPEALALLRFAVSDAYDDLAAAMEG